MDKGDHWTPLTPLILVSLSLLSLSYCRTGFSVWTWHQLNHLNFLSVTCPRSQESFTDLSRHPLFTPQPCSNIQMSEYTAHLEERKTCVLRPQPSSPWLSLKLTPPGALHSTTRQSLTLGAGYEGELGLSGFGLLSPNNCSLGSRWNHYSHPFLLTLGISRIPEACT